MRRKIFAVLMVLCLLGNKGVVCAQEEPELIPQVISEEVTGELLDVDAHSASECQTYGLNEAVYQESYGKQLEKRSVEVYDVLKTKYKTEKVTGEITFTLSQPIQFDATVVDNKIVQDENFNQVRQDLISIIQASGDAFLYDYPEVFWIRYFSYKYGIKASQQESSVTGWRATISEITLIPNAYYEGAEDELAAYESAIQESVAVIKEMRDNDSDYYTVKAIQDYLCDELSYHYGAASDPNNEAYLYAHTSSTAFIGDKKVVCEGYAKAMKVLCDCFNIPCALVVGTGYSGGSSGGHMWNDIQIDGKWYAVDVTWDDGSRTGYDYFLSGRNTIPLYGNLTFAESHVEDGDFSGSGIFNFVYPQLEAEKYEEPELTYMRGDVNQDNKVTIKDLRLILHSLSGKELLSEEQNVIADINSNGNVDIQDLRVALRYVCGKIGAI